MSRRQHKHFETILTWQLEKLQDGVSRTVGLMQDEPTSLPDPIDQAQQEESMGLELKTRDRERKLINKIQQALDLIDRGEYGYCRTCGEDIGLRRLEARPAATQCIFCKELEEKEERNFGG